MRRRDFITLLGGAASSEDVPETTHGLAAELFFVRLRPFLAGRARARTAVLAGASMPNQGFRS